MLILLYYISPVKIFWCVKYYKAQPYNMEHTLCVCSTNTFKPDTIIQALIEKGFTKIKSQGYYWLRIEVEAFEKLRQTHDDDIEEVEFETD